MFIQTEQTPNPNTLKFIPGVEVLGPGKTYEFKDVLQARVSPLAEKLFQIENVEGVFFGEDFISVSKGDDTDWSTLKTFILSTIMDYFLRYKVVEINKELESSPECDNSQESSSDSEIIKEIKDLINSRVRPAVAADGGDIIFEKFEDGIVYLRMQGACSGCPSSSATLKSGIENMLRYYIPEVQEVQAVA